jgi:UDP-N-acetylmuramoyl-tripeptide--D-alanyl-D-alanine ligase
VIPLTVTEVARISGGVVHGDPAVVVTAPVVADGRLADAGALFAAFAGAGADGHDFVRQAAVHGAVAVLGTRPTSLTTVVVPDVLVALQRLAGDVVRRLRPGLQVTGVTGSQGKTSTKDLLAAVLSCTGPTVATIGNLNNELGVPLTMLRVESGTRSLLLEMGARRVGDLAERTRLVAPDIAIVLNVGAAHLGEFGSRDRIALGKGELVEGLAPGGTAVLNADDPLVLGMRARTAERVVTFGAAADADVRVRDVRLDERGRPTFVLRAAGHAVRVALPISGAHQALNAAAAAAAGLTIGMPLDDVAAALETTELSPMRLQLRDLANGAMLIDDSYNSSPGSARSALDTMAAMTGRRRIAVLGEILELGADSEAEHREVGAYAAERADIVVAVGEGALGVAVAAGKRGIAVADNAEAAAWLRAEVRRGDLVLVKGSRGAHLEEVVAAIATIG